MNFFLHTLASAFMILPTVLGFNLVFGKGKILHFGQEAFAIVAAYSVWVAVVRYQIPFGIGLGLGLGLVVLVALLLAWLSFRLEADGFGVMSIALHLVFLAVVLNWQSVTRGSLGIPKIPRWELFQSLEAYTLLCILVVIVWVVFILWLDRGKFGRNLSALAEHPWHAQSLGINRKRIHTIAFIIAALGALTSNVLLPPYIHILTPNDYGFPAMILFVMIVVSGGPGRVWGVIAATFILMFLKEGIRFVALPPDMIGPVRLMLFGIILFVAVWWRRDSIFPQERKI
ncbi:branched-chain amino acid ABC transporter permease [Patescibacteria group bacterium]|nr:branched-chain amino acid ABC transporter permease [Patescibacteria group bacterium]